MDIEHIISTGNSEQSIVTDIRMMITEARQRVAVTANSAITLLYWNIGERINREVLGGLRADYGKRIVENIAIQLQHEFGGREFSVRNLRRMMQFAQSLPDIQIVSTLST